MWKTAIRLIALIAASVASTAANAQPACSTPNDNSCAAYTGCIEKNCRCDSTASKYVVQFGFKYCQRFAAEMRFSGAGQSWRDKTLRCLRDEIAKSYVQNSQPCNCAKIQADAIASHNKCYTIAPSFCSLNDSDIKVVARIVDIGDALALGRPGFIETAKTLVVCHTQVGVTRGAQIAGVFLLETLDEGREMARNYVIQVAEEGRIYAIAKGLPQVAKKFEELRDSLKPVLP
ncbi:hypothetical protein [Hyphomicrobium sp. LHD-15]|uniref:hypothetical protein n=1 Tax=Hyphomicrobium sp. LHD-15 TaxID=3072142 RepID=UPI00280F1DB1|nr:hypothetical protein [Hyphomicrobium sp. LHD-15]MDQ8700594.1 hypothetical protein [Hyphomicrobium sp. LHD-15]